MSATPVTRRQAWRWLGWFTAANAGLYLLVGLRYLQGYQWPDSLAGIAYVPVTMLGHFAVLAVVPAVLLLGPLIALRPMRRTLLTLAIVLAAISLALLVLDTNVFAERRLHLSLFIAVLFEPVTWFAGALVLGVALVFEALLGGALWRWLADRPRPAGGLLLGVLLATCWLTSQGLHIWADAVGYSPVTRFTAYLPLYYPVHAKRQLARLGLIDQERVRQARLLRQGLESDDGDLRYPLSPLRCPVPAKPPLNVLWVVIDALRPDAVDPVVTPALTAFRGESQAFDNHWSGGNSSRMGAFSMFYGLPGTYFQSFYSAQRPPIMLDQFRAEGYDVLAISAVGFGSPTLTDRTVFSGVPAMTSTKELSPVEANVQATRDFSRWLATRKSARPFFSVLWFNPPIANIPLPAPDLQPDGRYGGNPRANKLWNEYRRGVRLVDSEFREVLGALDRAGHSGDTLVLVMGDHGYEFDDLGLGYYMHASNFGQYQLRAAFMLRWPGRAPQAFTHRTSHLDIPTTLLQEVLGCQNPPSDYSMGRNLFSGVSWDWIIAGSYQSYAIVEPQRIMVTEPGGFAEVLGPDYRAPADASLDAALIEKSMAEMRRFYR